jgi:hypothetical protein
MELMILGILEIIISFFIIKDTLKSKATVLTYLNSKVNIIGGIVGIIVGIVTIIDALKKY